MKLLSIAVLCCTAAAAQTFHGAADLDAVINQAIREDKIPGAVVLAGQAIYSKAEYHQHPVLRAGRCEIPLPET